MKMSTTLYARFQSHGYPAATITMKGTNREIMAEYISWLSTVKMGSRITLVMTRSEAELESGRGAPAISDDIMAEFSHLLSEEGVD